MRKKSRKRSELVDSVEKKALLLFEKLERDFYRSVINEFRDLLTFKDNMIVNSTKNHVALHKLAEFQEKFKKEKVMPIITWIANQLMKITKTNVEYFDNFDVKKIQGKVTKDSVAKYGIKKTGNVVKIAKGSLLDQLSKFEEPYMAIRNIGTRAIAQGMPLKEFQSVIKNEILPEGKFGKIKSHFQTIAQDLFVEHDRNVNNEFADRLGLMAFIYEGGLIETSREFCQEKNGKVFTREEAEQWAFEDFDGKPSGGYDPLSNMGGYNCRHHAGWIDEKEAIRRRPDLEQYFKDKKANR